MTAALVVIVVALIVELAARRIAERDHERVQNALLADQAAERKEWMRERQLLLNRIKPETAQYVAPEVIHPQPEAVSMFDDEDYWESKDELAERAMAEELNG